jgi:hypothetical protein
LPNALDIDYLNKYFLNTVTNNAKINIENKRMTSSQRQVKLRSTCAVTGDGLFEALDVLHEMILKKHKNSKSKR